MRKPSTDELVYGGTKVDPDLHQDDRFYKNLIEYPINRVILKLIQDLQFSYKATIS